MFSWRQSDQVADLLRPSALCPLLFALCPLLSLSTYDSHKMQSFQGAPTHMRVPVITESFSAPPGEEAEKKYENLVPINLYFSISLFFLNVYAGDKFVTIILLGLGSNIEEI